MIEVVETYRKWPLALGQQATYDVLVDGQSVARYPSRNEAEVYAEQLKKEARDAD
jgi:ATP-dependent Clp protease adapter protein ClpS